MEEGTIIVWIDKERQAAIVTYQMASQGVRAHDVLQTVQDWLNRDPRGPNKAIILPPSAEVRFI